MATEGRPGLHRDDESGLPVHQPRRIENQRDRLGRDVRHAHGVAQKEDPEAEVEKQPGCEQHDGGERAEHEEQVRVPSEMPHHDGGANKRYGHGAHGDEDGHCRVSDANQAPVHGKSPKPRAAGLLREAAGIGHGLRLGQLRVGVERQVRSRPRQRLRDGRVAGRVWRDSVEHPSAEQVKPGDRAVARRDRDAT